MKIALIHCSLGHRIFSENLKVVDEDFCLAPPIVLAYVAAILGKSRHQVLLIDANVLKLSKQKVLRILDDFNPSVIGFRVDTYWFHRVVEWATYFKDNLKAKVIVGGINVDLYPKESLSRLCFDYGICGEANESLPKLINAIEKESSLENIQGLVYRHNGEVKYNPRSDKLMAFDDYPFPARQLLRNDLYYSFTSQRKNFTIMLTSTGCPYKCNFCAISRLAYRERSPENIVDEMGDCFNRYRVREIDFFDATFFINKERSMRIFEEILRRGIKIEWSCRSRVDVVDEEILKLASRAGCKKIYYGIESASVNILNNINKNVNVARISETIALTRKYRIGTLGFFMVGNPGETQESILPSIKLAKKLNLDFIQVCRVIAKPNTDLNDCLIKKCKRDFWRKHIESKELDRRLPAPWTDLSEEEVERSLRKFYFDFYFRPVYIFHRFLGVKSIGEFLRYLKVGFRWLFYSHTK